MAKQHWNVLVFPGGMENGIEIYNSLKNCKEVTLFSASASIPNQAFYLYKENHICPDVREDSWVDVLNKIVEDNKIDIIYPANSLVIDALYQNKDMINCNILLPGDEALAITRSKKRTIEILSDVIPVPKVYTETEKVDTFPIFVKPDRGYGAQGAKVVETSEELATIDYKGYIVEELLPGKEYTVDCFSDRNGNLLFSSGRERSRIRMATSMHAEPVSADLDKLFEKYARLILSKIKINGAWFFQMKKDASGELKLLEIDIRIAGTMCYDRCKGVNFPLLSLYDYFGLPVGMSVNKEKLSLDRCLHNRYLFDFEYINVYIDLDDTIIFNGQYNTDIMKFIFQCLNKKKNVVLLSKHIGDGDAYLKQWRLDNLFSSIVWMEEEDEKYKYINPERSIYIDDSFSQRKQVAEKCGIPTFDASMIECLIDDRI